MTDLQWKFFEAFKIEFRAKVQKWMSMTDVLIPLQKKSG